MRRGEWDNKKSKIFDVLAIYQFCDFKLIFSLFICVNRLTVIAYDMVDELGSISIC